MRNPVNPRQVSRVTLTPDVVDGFVFWTKNPAPMLNRLPELKKYAYYFQYTLTPYNRVIEPGVPDAGESLRTMQRLSERVGADRVIWRYDPVILSAAYPPQAHLRLFRSMARQLQGFTNRVIISFLDREYRNARRNADALQPLPVTVWDKQKLAGELTAIAREHGMEMQSCASAIDLTVCGITPSHCVDKTLFEKLLGCPLQLEKDPNQRPACGCAQSVDIGMYNTCENGCLYCYANYNAGEIQKNRQKHNPASPLLIGETGPMDIVRERVMQSNRDLQTRMQGL